MKLARRKLKAGAATWPSKIRDAKALYTIRDEFDRIAPQRAKSSDGIRASKQHSAVNPNSDHEPHVMDGDTGVFTAIDITHDPRHGVDTHKIAREMAEIADPRIKYIISKGEIWNPSVANKWRKRNKGPDDHYHHMHISLKAEKTLYDNTYDFNLGSFDGVEDQAAAPVSSSLQRGASGDEVKELQRLLNISVDGDFGEKTEKAVIAYQTANGLHVDGKVGAYTWAKLRANPVTENTVKPSPVAVDLQVTTSTDSYTPILDMAAKHDVAQYQWKNRGRAPIGFVKGIALSFASLLQQEGSDLFKAITDEPERPDRDAVAHFRSQLQAIGANPNGGGVDALTCVFILLMGLGMRESSGRHCEGRDRSARNTRSDTAEAGLYQVSWDSRTAHPLLVPLMRNYNDNGFQSVYHEGVQCSARDLLNSGIGEGVRFQEKCKLKPDFATRYAALLLRYQRSHWGPIIRREVEVKESALDLFMEVRRLVEGGAMS